MSDYLGPWWVTRDSDKWGRALDVVDVWVALPSRVPAGNGFLWIGAFHGRYRMDDPVLLKWCRSLPDTDRECVRVG